MQPYQVDDSADPARYGDRDRLQACFTWLRAEHSVARRPALHPPVPRGA